MMETEIAELIEISLLMERVRALKIQGYRLVQIGTTRLADVLELTYSFDRDSRLANLRVHLPATGSRLPSISSIYWSAFLYENEIHDLFGLTIEGMAVDFHGKLYQTAIAFPFGCSRAPVSESRQDTTGAAERFVPDRGANQSGADPHPASIPQ